MMKIKLSKNSWHYRFWTKCMKSDFLNAFFGVPTKWDNALWEQCWAESFSTDIEDQSLWKSTKAQELYDREINLRKIPQDLCTYMRNLMLMVLLLVISGSIIALLSLITIVGFVVIPFDIMGHIWARLFVEIYPRTIGLGVIAWFALLVYVVGITILKVIKTYADNRYKDGTISYWINNLHLPKLKSKVRLTKAYKQPWDVILLEYYCSIKEKTCKKIEFED